MQIRPNWLPSGCEVKGHRVSDLIARHS
uniref:Uncharacterized protein n=1 Tax=Anguilla anguilla TaxID=7936 RepID=A0A0E9RP10_ANGAN